MRSRQPRHNHEPTVRHPPQRGGSTKSNHEFGTNRAYGRGQAALNTGTAEIAHRMIKTNDGRPRAATRTEENMVAGRLGRRGCGKGGNEAGENRSAAHLAPWPDQAPAIFRGTRGILRRKKPEATRLKNGPQSKPLCGLLLRN